MITSDLAVITTTIITRDKIAVRAGKGPALVGTSRFLAHAGQSARQLSRTDVCTGEQRTGAVVSALCIALSLGGSGWAVSASKVKTCSQSGRPC